MLEKGDTCVLVCSHDSYDDLWPIFFHFFKKNWNNCPYPVFLSTETKSFSYDGVNVKTINTGKPTDTWCKILEGTLKKLPYNNIIILLEDFFIVDRVNNEVLNSFTQLMRNDKLVACINLSDQPVERAMKKGYELHRKPTEWGYWVCFLPAIWSRQALLDLISPYESAWQFEVFGTERAKYSKWKFFEAFTNSSSVIPVKWGIRDKGYGVCQGKWTRPTEGFFRSEGINIDFSIRGFCDPQAVEDTLRFPRMLFRHKWRYFLHGGLFRNETDERNNITFCLSLKQQFYLFFLHPKTFIKILHRKFGYLFGRYEGKTVETSSGLFLD